MAIRPDNGGWRPPLTLPNWNRVTVLALLLLASFSFGQARRGLLYGLSPDDLVPVEKAAAGGGLPRVVTPLTIDMPIDHFNKSDHRTYENRYWVNASYYKEGGPVFL
jgi:Serine carboxypeptidase S28